MTRHVTKWVPLASLARIETVTDPRRLAEIVAAFDAWLFRGGTALPPILLNFALPGGFHFIDGNHRLTAARRLGLVAIKVRVACHDEWIDPPGWSIACGRKHRRVANQLCAAQGDDVPHLCGATGRVEAPFMREFLRACLQRSEPPPFVEMAEKDLAREIGGAIARNDWKAVYATSATLAGRALALAAPENTP